MPRKQHLSLSLKSFQKNNMNNLLKTLKILKINFKKIILKSTPECTPLNILYYKGLV